MSNEQELKNTSPLHKEFQNLLDQDFKDRRLKENGGRIYRLAEIAANDKDYDAAIVAYNYIVREKGKMSSYYIESKRESLTCKRKKLVEGFDYTDQDLKTLEAEYQFFLNELRKMAWCVFRLVFWRSNWSNYRISTRKCGRFNLNWKRWLYNRGGQPEPKPNTSKEKTIKLQNTTRASCANNIWRF